MESIRFAETGQALAAGIALWRSVTLGLGKKSPALLAWLGLQVALHLAGAGLPHYSPLYFWLYIVSGPLECLVGVIAVHELFSLVFVNYPGIRSAGRWSMYTGIALATAGALLMMKVFTRTSTHGSLHLFNLEVAQRSVVFTLAVVILTILFFLSRYPLHLGTNTYVSSAFFSATFLSTAIALLIDSLQTQLYSNVIDWGEGIFSLACLLGWAWMLQPETASKPAPPPAATPQEEHLLEQLDALNRLLGGLARR